MVTVQGLLPPRWRAPFLGEIETPRRLTLAVEVARGGFFVRGAMLFDSAAQAERFIAAFGKAQANVTTSPLGKALLGRFHLFHALSGLSFKRNGTKVAYATSISVADARGLLDRTAAQVRSFFDMQRRPTPAPSKPLPDTAPSKPLPDTAPSKPLPDTAPSKPLPDTAPSEQPPDTAPTQQPPDTAPTQQPPDTAPTQQPTAPAPESPAPQ
jgi:hypothetical protein